mgnify:CR=1 FL=1
MPVLQSRDVDVPVIVSLEQVASTLTWDRTGAYEQEVTGYRTQAIGTTFASLGLFAPRNATVYAVLLVCALSVSTAIFLILEMDQPYDGLLRISSGPLVNAVAEISR